jgi:hypothetical protein
MYIDSTLTTIVDNIKSFDKPFVGEHLRDATVQFVIKTRYVC